MSIAQVYAEGRLIRNEWEAKEGGRQLLCLYTAMVGDPDARPQDCPAHLCSSWLAHLLPWLDDRGTEAAWPEMVRRVAELAPHFGKLHPHVEWQVRATCVREVMQFWDDDEELTICRRAADLCDRQARGENVLSSEFDSVRADATEVSKRVFSRGLLGIIAVVSSAMLPRSEAALWALEEAASVAQAAYVAERHDWMTNEARVAGELACMEFVDRVTNIILDLIEKDLNEQGLLQSS